MHNLQHNATLRFGIGILCFLVIIASCKKLDLKREAAVNTDGVVLNSDNSVTAYGTLLDLGESAVTEHGHCWALNAEPTPADNYISLGSAGETGTFQTIVPSLETGTWYLRAYLVTEANPSAYIYGDVMTVSVSGFICGSILTDTRDGNTYSTVQIGSQCWMASNLDYGTLISSNNASDNQVDNSIVEKYCYGDAASACTGGGGLYQWGEAMNYSTVAGTQGICPEGWHVPTDAQWKGMEFYLGMDTATAKITNWRGTDEGTKIKLGGSTGFQADGTGYRKSDGSFYGNPEYGYFWTSTLQGTGTQAWVRGVMDGEAGIYRNPINYSYGLCIRCLKD